MMKIFSSMESAKGDPSSSSTLSSLPFRLHILVVDDDPTCLMVLAKMLRKCRYEGVTMCKHATIALSLLQGERAEYDIVLTDVHMPDVDGFKLLEIVGLEMDLPVLMMSADCDMNVAMRGLEHGACYYLMKPISIHEIKRTFGSILFERRVEADTILELMDVPGLTREDAATHLEKYRLYLHKLNEYSLASY
ncbi:hypothetical protein AAC387_Pa05g3263 [Persea americana]